MYAITTGKWLPIIPLEQSGVMKSIRGELFVLEVSLTEEALLTASQFDSSATPRDGSTGSVSPSRMMGAL